MCRSFGSFWVLLTILAALFAETLPAQQPEGIDGRIAELIERNSASDAFWSVSVTDPDGNRLAGYEENRLVRPASVQKLLVSAAILHGLGPDYRFSRLLCAAGERDGERWNGDLVIRGSGDPTINDDFHADPLFLFEKWADRLEAEGIGVIAGDLVADESRFDDKPWPRGWEWDDLSYYYAVKIAPLSFNKNVVNLEVRADGPPGSRPSISWFPFDTPYVTFVNEQVITPSGTRFEESYRRLPGSNTILLRSTLPQGYLETEPLSISDPARYFLDTFRRYLERRGIVHEGELLSTREQLVDSPQACGLADLHLSVPLSQILAQVNRESENFYTEMLLKTLAAERTGRPGSTEEGLEIVERFLAGLGIDTRFLRMRDASGMAPANLLRTSDVNRLLAAMSRSEHNEYFRATLAVSGLSGTLSHRFHGSPVARRFAGKTGFLTGVRTLSGYLTTRSGREVIVTLATNNYTVGTGVVDLAHQRILELLYAEL